MQITERRSPSRLAILAGLALGCALFWLLLSGLAVVLMPPFAWWPASAMAAATAVAVFRGERTLVDAELAWHDDVEAELAALEAPSAEASS